MASSGIKRSSGVAAREKWHYEQGASNNLVQEVSMNDDVLFFHELLVIEVVVFNYLVDLVYPAILKQNASMQAWKAASRTCPLTSTKLLIG